MRRNFSRLAAYLAGMLRLITGALDEHSRRLVSASKTNTETQCSRLFLDLEGDNRRHCATRDLSGDFRTQAIDDAEPAITATKTPAHAGFVDGYVPVGENIRISLAKQIIEFLSHIGHYPRSPIQLVQVTSVVIGCE